MRWSAEFPTVGRRATRRAYELRALVDTLQPPLTPEEKRRVAFVSIEALNLWAGFSRSYYLSSALRAKDGTGAKVMTSQRISHPRDAVTFAVHWWKPKLKKKSGPWAPFDEPPWTIPSKLLDLLSALGASNAPVVATAISASPQSFRDLKAVRNFFAHRGEAARREVQGVARNNLLNPALLPTDLVTTRASGRPQNLLADWIDDMRFAIESMAS